MRIHKLIAISVLAALPFATLTTRADDTKNANIFVKMCEESKDGVVTKEQVMQRVSATFDKMDTKKTGKMDKKQAEAFVKMLMSDSMGG